MYIDNPFVFKRFGGTVNDLPSLAIQSAKDDADINVMMKRFGITGQIPQVPVPPTPKDFESVFDFQSAMNVILAGQKSFMALNADVRARFNNDPARFLEFIKPENAEELVRMGLAVKVPDPPQGGNNPA